MNLDNSPVMACTDATFSQNGNLIGAVFNDSTEAYAQVWNVETGASITQRISGNESPITKFQIINGEIHISLA